jgi:protein subunit release factor B
MFRSNAILRGIPSTFNCLRALTTSAVVSSKSLPARLVIPETDIEENFLKGSGPGGQKIVWHS